MAIFGVFGAQGRIFAIFPDFRGFDWSGGVRGVIRGPPGAIFAKFGGQGVFGFLIDVSIGHQVVTFLYQFGDHIYGTHPPFMEAEGPRHAFQGLNDL